MQPHPRLLLSLLVVAACHPPPPAASVEIPDPAPSPPSPPPSSAPAPLPPRTALYLRGTDTDRLQIVRAGSDSPLGFTVASSREGRIQVGDDRPRLSADGALLAYGVRGRLWLARTDGSTPPQPVTTFDRGELLLLLGGFSPDGRALLFHQEKRTTEDRDPPFPRGFVEGFHIYRLTDRRVLQAPRLDGFDAWDPDGRRVVFDRAAARDRHDLVRSDPETGESAVLQTTTDAYGFGQISRCGADLVFVVESRMVRSKPDGSDSRPIRPKGRFAEYQYPRCAPGGAHVAYQHRPGPGPNDPGVIEIAPGTGQGEARIAHRCRHLCGSYGWESATQLLVLDDDNLYRVDLDGNRTRLASGVVDLVLPDP